MSNTTTLRFLLILVVTSFYCSTQQKWQGEIEVKNGITYVHNPIKGLWEGKKEIHYVKELTIGASGGDETLIFHRISDIAVDSLNNIYIADSGNQRIVKCSSDGSFLLSIGRKGKGPGEFMQPNDIEITDQQLLVLDKRLRRISIFDSNGNFLNSFKFNLRGENFLVNDKNQIVVIALGENNHIFHIFDFNGNRLESFGMPTELDDERYKDVWLLKLPPSSLFARNGSLMHTSLVENEISIYDTTRKLIMKIDRLSPFFTTPTVKEFKYKSGAVGLVPVIASEPLSIIQLNENLFAVCFYNFLSEDEKSEYFLDLYEISGRFLGKFNVPVNNDGKYFFIRNKLYYAGSIEVDQVFRFSLEINEET